MFKCPKCKGMSMITVGQEFFKVKNNLAQVFDYFECTECGHVKTEKEIFDPKDEGLTMEELFPDEKEN